MEATIGEEAQLSDAAGSDAFEDESEGEEVAHDDQLFADAPTPTREVRVVVAVVVLVMCACVCLCCFFLHDSIYTIHVPVPLDI